MQTKSMMYEFCDALHDWEESETRSLTEMNGRQYKNCDT